MADKTLSSIVGGGGKEIGDIFRTKASSLPDGKILLSCDGTVINAGTYPLLAAMFSAGVSFSPPQASYAADATSLHSRTPVTRYVPRTIRPLCAGAARTIGIDSAAAIWLQDATDASRVQLTPSATDGFPECSADAAEVMYPYVTAAAPADLYIYYTITTGDPTTQLLITATGAFAGAEPIPLMNAAGNDAKIIAFETGGSTIDTWTNGGTDIATGWAETSSIAVGTSHTAIAGSWGYSDDLLTIAIPRATNGAIISTDGGATWTQDILINGNELIYSMAVSTNDTVFAISAGTTTDLLTASIWSTTDSGATWVNSLSQAEMHELTELDVDAVEITRIINDVTGRIYVFGSIHRNADSSTTIYYGLNGCWYSEDNGTTWSFSVIRQSNYHSDPRMTGVVNTFGYAISKDELKFLWSGPEVSEYFVLESALTFGKVLPYVPGYKIVADAP